MKIFVGVTDNSWFEYLASRRPLEVNFWRPNSKQNFQAISPGNPFLFKLHSPLNFIVGGGFFVKHSVIPLSLAWECFGENNGAATFAAVRKLINRCRNDTDPNPVIGCTILTEPFFWDRSAWIPVPTNWSSNLVTGKTYSTDEVPGRDLWKQVSERLYTDPPATLDPRVHEPQQRYGKEFLTRTRLGQGSFRLLVTEAYKRRCSVTGERTLPVLEAAHIQPFADLGPNSIANGILLRSDLHILFDNGYVTLTEDSKVLVSRRIREEFENGRDYYAYHGRQLAVMPESPSDRPNRGYIRWHNEHVFVA